MPRPSTLAVASLVATGLFLIAISLPPLYEPIFGEEPESYWWPDTVANGLLYLATAALVGVFRTRLGVGLAMVLGMIGFTLALGFVLSRFGSGFVGSRSAAEVVVMGLFAAAHAVVLIGVLDGARRWNLVADMDTHRRAAAALLAGIGFALALGVMGGDYGITLTPISMPRVYQALEYTIAIPHFVGVAAIVLNGRFATIGSLAVAVAGVLLAVQVLAALVGWRDGIEFLLDSVVLWASLLFAWAAAGLLALAPVWAGIQGAMTKPLASDRRW